MSTPMSNRTEQIADSLMHKLGNISSRTPIADPQKYAINQNESDCISCMKHVHGVPKKKLCQSVCGT